MAHENFGEIIEGVEILSAGTHTASSGQQVTIGAEDLVSLASGYDPSFHEAPVVIGHPTDNQPAYGWVKGLKVIGEKLVATLDLVPQFVEAVRQGLFKKRSASIYQDLDGKGMYLRHVGFLGAVPPAVKALSDINLDDKGSDFNTIEFEERKPMNWKDWFKKRIDEMPDDGAPVVISHSRQDAAPTPAPVQFSEEQVKQREQQASEAAAKKAKEEAALEFAEKMSKLETDRKAAEHQGAVKAKLDALAKDGKIIPAWRKAGLDEFAQALGFAETSEFEFHDHVGANGGSPVRKSPCDWFFEFIEKLPAVVNLGEVAGKGNDVTTGAASARLGQLVQKKMADKPELGYSMAFSEVQQENPDLAREYLAEMKA